MKIIFIHENTDKHQSLGGASHCQQLSRPPTSLRHSDTIPPGVNRTETERVVYLRHTHLARGLGILALSQPSICWWKATWQLLLTHQIRLQVYQQHLFKQTVVCAHQCVCVSFKSGWHMDRDSELIQRQVHACKKRLLKKQSKKGARHC